MDVILPLVGVVLGSAATLIAQLLVRGREERERLSAMLLEACANIYTLEDLYLAIAGADTLGNEKRSTWPRRERALAGAQVQLIAGDDRLRAEELRLRASGKAIWWGARRAAETGAAFDLEAELDAHRVLLDHFTAMARDVIRRSPTNL